MGDDAASRLVETQQHLRDLSRHNVMLGDAIDVVETHAGESIGERDFVLWFHSKPKGTAAPAALGSSVSSGRCIPIISEGADANSLPEDVAEFNAIRLGVEGATLRTAVEHALSSMLLLRPERRVFISYRRSESDDIAEALQRRLMELRYEVFRDVTSVDYGVDVQPRVIDSILDADAVVLLASPGIVDSEWVMKEIQTTNRAYIGLVVAIWPLSRFQNAKEPAILSTVFPDNVIRLEEDDFDGEKKWKPHVQERVLERLERNRVGGIVRRAMNMFGSVEERWSSSHRIERSATCLNDAHMFKKSDGSLDTIVRIVPHFPTVETIHGFSTDLGSEAPEEVTLCYTDDIGASNRTTALRWAMEADRPGAPRRFHLQTVEPKSNPGEHR